MMELGWHTSTEGAVEVIALPLGQVRAMATSINRASLRIIEMVKAFADLEKKTAVFSDTDMEYGWSEMPRKAWAEFRAVMTRGFPAE